MEFKDQNLNVNLFEYFVVKSERSKIELTCIHTDKQFIRHHQTSMSVKRKDTGQQTILGRLESLTDSVVLLLVRYTIK